MALLWKMICNLGDPMSLRHPVLRLPQTWCHTCTPTCFSARSWLKKQNLIIWIHAQTPTSHIRAYMLFRVAFILGADLGEPFLDVGQELQKIVVGQEERVPRWFVCSWCVYLWCVARENLFCDGVCVFVVYICNTCVHAWYLRNVVFDTWELVPWWRVCFCHT